MPGWCPVVAFYRLERDNHGRRVADIWTWDDHRLEARHDFIQYLFPLREPSPVVPDAPCVTDETAAAFASDQALRDRLTRSLDRMLTFYGLRHDPTSGRVERAKRFTERAAVWLTPQNHNFLRLTSLHLLGLLDRSTALLTCLEGIAAEFPRVVGNSLAYWQATGRS